MVVKGTYDGTIFRNQEDGYSVFSIKTSDAEIPDKARSSCKYKDGLTRFTAVGYGLPESDKVDLLLNGDWESSKHGYQLMVASWETVIPQTIPGIRDYLTSGVIEGLSAQAVGRIVERFGTEALHVIENEPQRLLEIPGISPDALSAINASHKKARDISALEHFFAEHSASKKDILRVYDYFGPNSLAQVKRSPYDLCRVSGFDFGRVDVIARMMDCRRDDPQRIKAAALFVLEHAGIRSGHLYLPIDELCKKTLSVLNRGVGVQDKKLRLALGDVADVVYSASERKEVIEEDGCVYLPRHYRNELFVARRIAAMLATPPRQLDIRLALERAKRELSIVPSELQEAAVIMAFQHNLSIMTGLPGTGKTTVLKLIIAIFNMIYPDGTIMLAAPTGRASRRMAESTGFEGAKTMHSMLGLLTNDEEDSHINSRDPIEADFVIVDEYSMVDQWLAKELFSRLKPGTSLFLVGDAGQLPSVRPGKVFQEMIGSELIAVTALTQIFRQAEGSLISLNAERINGGETDLETGDDFYWVEFFSAKDTVDYLVESYLQEIAEKGISNVQILSPYSTEGIASAEKMNLVIRELANPAAEGKAEVRVGKKLFRENDRVMQTKNKREIANGDIGFIRSIRDVRGTNTSIVIEFAGGRVVEYLPAEMGTIELSYAVTVHKSMGSEFTVVLMPVLQDHARLLDRRLLNTAITRGIETCYLIGESHTLINSIRKCKTRYSRLGFQIKMQYAKLLSSQAQAPVPGHEQLRFTG